MKTLLRTLAPYAPDLQDVLVFGGLGIACYGIAVVIGGGWACIVGGAGLFWLGVRSA